MTASARAALVAAAVVAADQAVKALVRTAIDPGDEVDLFLGIRFVNVRNNGIAFLQGATPDNVTARIDEGVRVIAGHNEASAIKGRAHQKRKMPV